MDAAIRAKLDKMEVELRELKTLLSDPVALSLLLYQLISAANPN